MIILAKKNCTTIYGCYEIKDYKKVIEKLIEERQKRGFKCNRTFLSYKCELKAHARLYKLGLFRSHTMDADLEENITKTKEIVYHILGV